MSSIQKSLSFLLVLLLSSTPSTSIKNETLNVTTIPTNEGNDSNTITVTNIPTSTPTFIQTGSILSKQISSNPPTFSLVSSKFSGLIMKQVTSPPSILLTDSPTNFPTMKPTEEPTKSPSKIPTDQPTRSPTKKPTTIPTVPPSNLPTSKPTETPTEKPTTTPTDSPTNLPTLKPTETPTEEPTVHHSGIPTTFASNVPSVFFSSLPTLSSSTNPSNLHSGLPTVVSSTKPSSFPSTFPSNFPSHSPTEIPTSSPTVLPSSFPTAKPSLYPSTNPSLFPSSVPTKSPSETPTPGPSPGPTLTPTKYPSLKPSLLPSIEPSSVPSQYPSLIPSSYPSENPTSSPTSTPSQYPSLQPSQVPSLQPSSTPSLLPTFSPSVTPSASVVPSTNPTSTPSLSPTSDPSSQPSSNPTNVPTTSPSSYPSATPTLPLQEITVNRILMEFDDCKKLDSETTDVWQDITRDHIRKEIDSRGLDLEDLVIEVTKEQQWSGPFDDEEDGINNRQLLSLKRALQEKSPLRIAFRMDIIFRSTIYDHNVEDWVGGAFNSLADRVSYIDALQQTGYDLFLPINRLVLEIDGEIPECDGDGCGKEGNMGPAEIGIIAVSALGCVALLGGGAFMVRRRGQIIQTLPPPPPQERVSEFINVRPPGGHDEISTLGDPVYPPGMMIVSHVRGDDTVGDSLGEMYDYVRAYGGPGDAPSASTAGAATNLTSSRQSLSLGGIQSGGGNSTRSHSPSTIRGQKSTDPLFSDSIFSDDHSLGRKYQQVEERIEIHAPAGKLGMVIDAPNGGSPMVHAIKDSSVLVDKIRIGDRLISVDGEDTVTMSAMRVSKLISSKSENPSRQLVFMRTKQLAL